MSFDWFAWLDGWKWGTIANVATVLLTIAAVVFAFGDWIWRVLWMQWGIRRGSWPIRVSIESIELLTAGVLEDKSGSRPSALLMWLELRVRPQRGTWSPRNAPTRTQLEVRMRPVNSKFGTLPHVYFQVRPSVETELNRVSVDYNFTTGRLQLNDDLDHFSNEEILMLFENEFEVTATYQGIINPSRPRFCSARTKIRMNRSQSTQWSDYIQRLRDYMD